MGRPPDTAARPGQSRMHGEIKFRGRATRRMAREHDVDAKTNDVCNHGVCDSAVFSPGTEKFGGNIMEFRQDAAFLSCRYVRYAGQCDTDAAEVDGVTTAMAMPGLDEFGCDKGSRKE